MAYVEDAAASAPGAEPVTFEKLMKHYDKFGLDNEHTGWRGAAEVYKNYKKAREDSLIWVARTFLTQRAYLAVLDALNYGHFKDQAAKDWTKLHGEEGAA